jgi:hypothetical protein
VKISAYITPEAEVNVQFQEAGLEGEKKISLSRGVVTFRNFKISRH